MNCSLHDLTRAYITIDERLRMTLMADTSRRQLELFRDEIGEEIVTVVRAQMKETPEHERLGGR